MYGVSPAYFISAHTDRFTPVQVASSLADLHELGFTGYQLEVFHPDTLAEWADGGTAHVVQTGRKLGMLPTQFVGHFLLHGFGAPDALRDAWGVPEMERVMKILRGVPECTVVTVPLPAFSPAGDGNDYTGLFQACVRKLSRMLAIVEGAGRRMALEILPGALVSGADGFLRLRAAVGQTLGYNLDTGHAWAQKEPVEFLPEKLRGCIYGTHLCDNDAGVNESWRPGRGTVPWERTMAALRRTGYHGPMDLEIKCAPDEVAQEYTAGLRYLEQLAAERRDAGGPAARSGAPRSAT